MKHFIDLETWERKEIFEWFVKYDEPFYGVCVDIDCTKAYAKCKRENDSFFLCYLHKSLVAANSIEFFRYRIEDGKVVVYDEIHAGPTITRPNGTFGFADIRYYFDFEKFCEKANKEIEHVRQTKQILPDNCPENVIHYSSVPWIKFTALSHARCYSIGDCAPKISFGKLTESNGIYSMPMSIHVHHALVDGFHVGQLIDEFQRLMNEE